MESPLLIKVATLAATQHGILAVSHLTAAGVTREQRRRLVAGGLLTPLWHGAYRWLGAPESWKGDLLAACWAGGLRARSSHRSGAALWELPGGDRRLQELTCPRWRRARHDGLVVHESLELASIDVTVLDGIPVTTVPRTLLDLGAVTSALTVERALESALRRDLVTLDEMYATLQRLGCRGRRGAGKLRAVLAARHPERNLTESHPELLLLQIMRAHGLPEPVLQYEIRHDGKFIARVDAALVEWKISVEYESAEFHASRRALVRDSARRNAQVALGWKPISVTWDDLKSGGHRVCAEILGAMRLAS